jgi:hypothetical protein
MPERGILRFKSPGRLEEPGEQPQNKHSAINIAANARRFHPQIKSDDVFGTHRLLQLQERVIGRKFRVGRWIGGRGIGATPLTSAITQFYRLRVGQFQWTPRSRYRFTRGMRPLYVKTTPICFAFRQITRQTRERSPVSNTRLNESGMPNGFSTARQAPASERFWTRQVFTARLAWTAIRAAL